MVEKFFYRKNYLIDVIWNVVWFLFFWVLYSNYLFRVIIKDKNSFLEIYLKVFSKLGPAFWATYFSVRMIRPFYGLKGGAQKISNWIFLILIGLIIWVVSSSGFYGGIGSADDQFNFGRFIEALFINFWSCVVMYIEFTLMLFLAVAIIASLFKVVLLLFIKFKKRIEKNV